MQIIARRRATHKEFRVCRPTRRVLNKATSYPVSCFLAEVNLQRVCLCLVLYLGKLWGLSVYDGLQLCKYVAIGLGRVWVPAHRDFDDG
jgi:hypothetical protein